LEKLLPKKVNGEGSCASKAQVGEQSGTTESPLSTPKGTKLSTRHSILLNKIVAVFLA